MDATSPEERLLGGLIVGLTHRPAMFGTALAGLEPRHFADRRNRFVFGAVSALRRAGAAIDLVALAQHLWRFGLVSEAGGYARLAGLWTCACGPDEIPNLIEGVLQADRRKCESPEPAAGLHEGT